MADLRDFQARVKKWNDYNFPGKQPYQPLLGVVEECCGELRLADNPEDWEDSIGDTVVYLADFCNHTGIDMEDALVSFVARPWDDQATTPPIDALSAYCGMLCHAQLKLEQKIRGNEKHLVNRINAVGGLMYHLGRLKAEWRQIAVDVFARVEKRDWIKYPETGFPPGVVGTVTGPHSDTVEVITPGDHGDDVGRMEV